jgi:hypothetical protein
MRWASGHESPHGKRVELGLVRWNFDLSTSLLLGKSILISAIATPLALSPSSQERSRVC